MPPGAMAYLGACEADETKGRENILYVLSILVELSLDPAHRWCPINVRQRESHTHNFSLLYSPQGIGLSQQAQGFGAVKPLWSFCSLGVHGAQQVPGTVPRARRSAVSKRGAAPALTKFSLQKECPFLPSFGRCCF